MRSEAERRLERDTRSDCASPSTSAMGIAAEAAGLRERGLSVTERRQQEEAAEAEAEASRTAGRRRPRSEALVAVAANLSAEFDDAGGEVRGRVRMHAIQRLQISVARPFQPFRKRASR